MKHYGFLGGDVSKGMCDFKLIDYQGNQLESVFQLDDNFEGHKELKALLKKMKSDFKLSKIVVGLESTGGYENNWYRSLRSQKNIIGLEVFRINPKRIYFEAQTEGRRSIDDGVSASVIAGYLRKNYGHYDLQEKKQVTSTDQTGEKSLYNYIQNLVKQNTKTKNQLEKLLYSYLPELLSIKPEKYSDWFLDLLIEYPSRKKILSAGKQGLRLIKRLGDSKAEQILLALKQSVGGKTDLFIERAIKSMAEDIKMLAKRIKSHRLELAKNCKDTKKEELEIVESIKGIGIDTAVGILMEIGDLSRFEKAGNLVAFWGINPTFKHSGDKHYKIKMCKDGSPKARSLIYTAAKNAILHEPYFKSIYAKHRKLGKLHYVAIGAVMSKITRIIYGMLKSKSKFDAGVDSLNQTKHIEKTKRKKGDSKQRRFQNKKETAPISRRQKTKRKQEQNALS